MRKKTLKTERYDFMFDEINKFTNQNKEQYGCDYFGASTKLWYDTYRESGNDDALYDLPEYLWCCIGSYICSSKQYVQKIAKAFEKMQVKPKKILDFGAGVGLATYDLAEAFPDATIYYYNISKNQLSLFQQMLEKWPKENIVLIDKVDDLRDIDVVFCSELFEHIKEPVSLFKYVSEIHGVKMILEASSFRFSDVAGHYETFKFDDEIVSCNETQKRFNKNVRKLGFESSSKLYGISCWNNRPNIWCKQTIN